MESMAVEALVKLLKLPIAMFQTLSVGAVALSAVVAACAGSPSPGRGSTAARVRMRSTGAKASMTVGALLELLGLLIATLQTWSMILDQRVEMDVKWT